MKKTNNIQKHKEISSQEQKKLLLEMLKYIDGICRRNGIKYSLINGSLLGAIRHKGFIPWDDDIDIVLTKDNYDKLIRILNQEKGRYQILKIGKGGEYFTLTKLIDKKTHLVEACQQKFLPEYGVFIDIYVYYPTARDLKTRRKHYQKIKRLTRLIMQGSNSLRFKTLPRDLMRFCKNTILSNSLFRGLVYKSFLKTLNQYNNSEYFIPNSLTYGFEKDIQLKEDINEYIDVKFEGTDVMIFKNYDNILKTIYGDYMQLPPKTERVSRHNIKIWWRENEDA